MPDLARLVRDLAALTAEDAAWVHSPRRRLDLRDEALQAARALIPSDQPLVASCELERRLRAYLGSPAWQRDRWSDDAASAGELETLLHRIARLNAGRGLSARQIDNVVHARWRG